MTADAIGRRQTSEGGERRAQIAFDLAYTAPYRWRMRMYGRTYVIGVEHPDSWAGFIYDADDGYWTDVEEDRASSIHGALWAAIGRIIDRVMEPSE